MFSKAEEVVKVDNADNTDGRTFCEVHPTVETTLRCNKCGRYMCVKCAVRTPVGYRCKECVHQQQDVYFTATQRDYVIAAVAAFLVSIPIGYIVPKLGFFFVIILSLPAGGLISEIAMRAVGRRRGRYMWIAVGVAILAGAVVGALPVIQQVAALYAKPGEMRELFANELSGIVVQILLPPLLYVALCAGAAIARLRYGK
jgi:hypothetical protein